jgi:RNA polymerase sigma-70 factor, ECF subfamily
LDALVEASAVDAAVADPALAPEIAVLSAETGEVVQRALRSLPADQRLVVVLCDVQGLSYEEAADALQVAIGTVKSRLSRARTRLRDELAASGELPTAARRPTKEDLATT